MGTSVNQISFKWMGEQVTVTPEVGLYKEDDTIRITLFEGDGVPLNTLTTCLNLTGNMQEGMIVVKNYSENIPIVKELLRLEWMKVIDKAYLPPYDSEVLLCLVKDESVVAEMKRQKELYGSH